MKEQVINVDETKVNRLVSSLIVLMKAHFEKFPEANNVSEMFIALCAMRGYSQVIQTLLEEDGMYVTQIRAEHKGSSKGAEA